MDRVYQNRSISLIGVADNFPEQEVSKGVAKINRFHIGKEEAERFNLQALFHGTASLTSVFPGDYVRLVVDKQLMMSDTPLELRTNKEFIRNAHGEVMIAGLGIGLLLENLKPLVAEGKVTRIVVYEKYQEVIDLVAHRYSSLPLEIRCKDILEYRPPKYERYDCIYFDIWPSITQSNLKDMAILHHRWKYHKRPGGWMDSWMCKYLRNERRNSYNRW